MTGVQWVHLFPILNSQFSHQSPEIGHGGSIHTLEISKHFKSGPRLLPTPKTQLLTFSSTPLRVSAWLSCVHNQARALVASAEALGSIADL